MPKHKSEDFKISAIEYYLTEDVSQEKVCRIFKCSPRSLMRWVEKYDEEGVVKRHNRKPVAYKIKQNEVKFILDEIKKDKTITMEDLLAKVQLKYPNFDLIFFKIINDKLLFENNIDYLVHYHYINNKEDYLYNVELYLKKYNIDIIFLKIFYNEFSNKNDIDIIKKINNNINNYIISNESFDKEYPDFNLIIYKKFNKNIILNNDIKYKSYWYYNHKNINSIIYSLNTLNNKFPDFNSDLFKSLYNIDNIDNNNIEQLLDNLLNNMTFNKGTLIDRFKEMTKFYTDLD
jgi:transposase-like protein